MHVDGRDDRDVGTDVADSAVDEIGEAAGKDQRQLATAGDPQGDDLFRVDLALFSHPHQRAPEVFERDPQQCLWQAGLAEVGERKDRIAPRREHEGGQLRRQPSFGAAEQQDGRVVSGAAWFEPSSHSRRTRD